FSTVAANENRDSESLRFGGNIEFRRGIESFWRRRINDSLRWFQEAENRGYDPDECAARRWHCHMLLGRPEEAWLESDRTTSRGAPDPNRLWDGHPFTGKRVIVRCLHGFGDAIQFLRYARLIRATAPRVVVETHPELVLLLKGIAGTDDVITWAGGQSAGFTDWDQQIEVMELPRAFRTGIDGIPRDIPYLSVDPAARARSLQNLGATKEPRIGIL